MLRSRILEAAIAEQEAEIAAERKSQVGTGDRSAKIRTYNFPQSRVTDHRIGLTVHSLDAIMAGDLDDVVEGDPDLPAGGGAGGDAARVGSASGFVSGFPCDMCDLT